MRRSLPARPVVCARPRRRAVFRVRGRSGRPAQRPVPRLLGGHVQHGPQQPRHVVAVVNKARAAHANAIFAQVRRRGDSWYLDSLRGPGRVLPPPPPPPPAASPSSPASIRCSDLIAEAHAHGHRGPRVRDRGRDLEPASRRSCPSPAHAQHPFNLHGWNRAAQPPGIYTGRDNWLTRSLLPDTTPGAALTFQGHRIGAEFWMDPGHPDYAAYTVDVLTHLVRAIRRRRPPPRPHPLPRARRRRPDADHGHEHRLQRDERRTLRQRYGRPPVRCRPRTTRSGTSGAATRSRTWCAGSIWSRSPSSRRSRSPPR